MKAQIQTQPDEKHVLAKAVVKAGKALGLSREEVGNVIGRDRTSITRGVDPHSKSGELALLLIRCYRSLYVLMGGKDKDLSHWMHTANRHTQGIPSEQIMSITGLAQVVEYLDAIRGKI
ncbi:MAG: MbcA/ParS/Xre antitoxin family protein [Gammaproteobacteria bacterium]|nr:MbcA/ParS/Xre antitoxin family protein [Gammaproteobacteria bacterium]